MDDPYSGLSRKLAGGQGRTQRILEVVQMPYNADNK
jgi:hypothetical protein